MRRLLSALAAALVWLGVIATVQAAVITRTYYVSASGFQGAFGDPATPVDSWDVVFTITFDPTVDVTTETLLDSFSSANFNSGDYGPYLFVYDALTGRLCVGDHFVSNSCTVSFLDALLRLQLTDPDAPSFDEATYRTSFGTYTARTGSASTEAISHVPEPGTLALLSLGLAGLITLRRRRA